MRGKVKGVVDGKRKWVFMCVGKKSQIGDDDYDCDNEDASKKLRVLQQQENSFQPDQEREQALDGDKDGEEGRSKEQVVKRGEREID